MFSSKRFIVSGLIFKSFVHFEFVFVYGVRKCSTLVLLHVAIPVVFPVSLIEEAIFAPLYIITSLSKIRYP